MEIGDHLITPRAGYTHHGLYIGNNEVIHYSGFVDGFHTGQISIASLEDFANGREIHVKEHIIRTYDRAESVTRAYDRLGEDWYSLLFNNCEHFVTWCIVGLPYSQQVNDLIIDGYLIVRAVNKILSEKEIQQHLAATLTGLTIQKAAQEGITRQITNSVVSTGIKSTISSSAGTVAGAATGIGIASTTGTATAIASGLAVASAAPVVTVIAASVAVGYGVKKLVDWIWDD